MRMRRATRVHRRSVAACLLFDHRYTTYTLRTEEAIWQEKDNGAPPSEVCTPYFMTYMMMRAALRSCLRRSRVAVAQRHQSLTAFSASRSPVAADSRLFFSTEKEDAEEKPIIPGYGKGKTSTGLVRLEYR